jgi:heme O synthase-like polyprenyltransferase
MSDFLYLLAGFAIFIAICHAMYIVVVGGFVVWFLWYALVGHWEQKRKQAERAKRRAEYAAKHGTQS